MENVHRPTALLFLCIALLLAACAGPSGDEPRIAARLDVAAALDDGNAEGYARATEVRDLTFPADHGAHPDFRTEWWYFTGNLAGDDDRRFGYQLTFFRSAVAPPGNASATSAGRSSRWATRQIWMAHFAVTDVADEVFAAHQRFARGGPLGLAGVTAEPAAGAFRVWVETWEARSTAQPGSPGSDAGDVFPLRLTAAEGDVAIDLELGAGDGRVLQGDRGLSQKGSDAGNASYYYSYPRMPTTGTLTVGGRPFTVRGSSWLDREWSTSVLGPGDEGWDWFALQLDDGRELVFFQIRSGDPTPGLDYAALITGGSNDDRPARLQPLDAGAARLAVLHRWTSPRTGVSYPSGWRVGFPDAGLNLEITPLLPHQELELAIRYWEGAVRVEGTSPEGPVGGYGYAELTGYGEAAAGRGR